MVLLLHRPCRTCGCCPTLPPPSLPARLARHPVSSQHPTHPHPAHLGSAGGYWRSGGRRRHRRRSGRGGDLWLAICGWQRRRRRSTRCDLRAGAAACCWALLPRLRRSRHAVPSDVPSPRVATCPSALVCVFDPRRSRQRSAGAEHFVRPLPAHAARAQRRRGRLGKV